jgi:hypothetical protein
MRKLQRNTLVRVTGGVFPDHHGKVLRLVAPSETWADCWHTEPRRRGNRMEGIALDPAARARCA